ncbi:hypothetical protein RRG08_013527 [Elysia crispata]|uniref:Uncharacterized protein n=1 Tax=Elysia crispata TaxID=231223 RepID=A0AAE0Y0S4_9GAST|nr:hypothetical protein RRG08_013527 [Elysia crispata]
MNRKLPHNLSSRTVLTATTAAVAAPAVFLAVSKRQPLDADAGLLTSSSPPAATTTGLELSSYQSASTNLHHDLRLDLSSHPPHLTSIPRASTPENVYHTIRVFLALLL